VSQVSQPRTLSVQGLPVMGQMVSMHPRPQSILSSARRLPFRTATLGLIRDFQTPPGLGWVPTDAKSRMKGVALLENQGFVRQEDVTAMANV